ncbi:MAG TPA: mandelate racemase/muconate lactonizing enzyme family protein [Ktedonobacteraceae bacterium]|nr:mandelate racemase/muconate lactonizing enzyme family protein [Ktedonobacteraceae bacterium]
MKITGIDYHVLLIPEYDVELTSSAQDDLVVVIHTDEGIDGIGETDTNPWIARECIRARGTHSMGRGLEELLIGADPMQPENLWRKLYHSTKMTGRRGIMICALGAIDMALWDIRGKALGMPIYQLLGGAAKASITPYASLLPIGNTLESYQASLVEKVLQAKSQGFTAAKLEICINGPYAHHGLQERDEAVVAIVAACREAVGSDMVLMVDVAYAWSDTKAALRTINLLQSYDVFFIETPLDMDDLDGYAYLSDRSPIRIAAGEWQNTHFEFLDLVDRGKVDVLQPDIGRVGGFSEARLVCQIAADKGKLIVPHCWKSGIGIAASAHLCAATAHCPYIEFLPFELSESPLRRELVTDELRMVHGSLLLPEKPGLGVELNKSALQKYEVV